MVVHLVLLLALTGPAWGDTINPVVGDVSWVAATGRVPERADETTRIVTHLRFVHTVLAARDGQLSASQRQRRGTALATLARYVARGQFPRRSGDAYPGRRPRFIDDRGVHCAVGFLIAESDPELARTINASHEYDYVHDIADPRLLAWAASHGFTIDELAMIQPTYGGRMPPTPDSIKRRLEESKEWLALACPSNRAAATPVTLHVTGDKRGRAIATTKSTDPFARCIAQHASRIETGDDDEFIEKPKLFAFDITLEIDSPQAILERRLQLTDLDTYCTPRPGAIPEQAKIEIATTKEGLTVAATTTPTNSEIDRCIEERTRRWFDGFATIPGLAAQREIKLISRLATERFRQELQMTARSVAMACYAGKQPTATIDLTLSAKRDDAEFTIALATRDKQLTACMREKLPIQLRSMYSVSRRTAADKSESYFRIDTDLTITVPIILTKPEPKNPPRKPTFEMAL